MALRDGDKENFATMIKAHKAGRLCIVESRDLATGEYRALVCAMSDTEDGQYMPVPIAVMVWDNPFEQYADPTQDELPPAKD